MESEEEDEKLATILKVCFKLKFKFEIGTEVYRVFFFFLLYMQNIIFSRILY